MRAPPSPLYPIIVVSPFPKSGIDFIICNPHSAGGNVYIILAVDYFNKWAEAMPTFSADGKTTATFVFNHIIARFDVPQAIITDHGSHFRNIIMTKLTDQLDLRHDSSTLYYPQANVKTSTGFTPFQLVYGLEAVLPIECEILSLQLAIELLSATSEEEKCFLYFAQLDENRCTVAIANETHAKQMKAQYNRSVTPRNFSEGDLVLVYDQANDKLGAGKFVPI
eukprot:PITA_33864